MVKIELTDNPAIAVATLANKRQVVIRLHETASIIEVLPDRRVRVVVTNEDTSQLKLPPRKRRTVMHAGGK